MLIRYLLHFLLLVAAVNGWANEDELLSPLQQPDRPTSIAPT